MWAASGSVEGMPSPKSHRTCVNICLSEPSNVTWTRSPIVISGGASNSTSSVENVEADAVTLRGVEGAGGVAERSLEGVFGENLVARPAGLALDLDAPRAGAAEDVVAPEDALFGLRAGDGDAELLPAVDGVAGEG